jgi:hypothetical protein
MSYLNLARHMYLAIVLHWIKWASSCKHCSTLLTQSVSAEIFPMIMLHSSIKKNFQVKDEMTAHTDDYLAPCIGLFSRALSLRCWVGQGKNDRHLQFYIPNTVTS